MRYKGYYIKRLYGTMFIVVYDEGEEVFSTMKGAFEFIDRLVENRNE